MGTYLSQNERFQILKKNLLSTPNEILKLEKVFDGSSRGNWSSKKSQAMVNLNLKRKKTDSIIMSRAAGGLNSVKSSSCLESVVPLSEKHGDFAIKVNKPTISETEITRLTTPRLSKAIFLTNRSSKRFGEFKLSHSKSKDCEPGQAQDEVSLYHSRVSMAAARAMNAGSVDTIKEGLSAVSDDLRTRVRYSKRSLSDLDKKIIKNIDLSEGIKYSVPGLRSSIRESLTNTEDVSGNHPNQGSFSLRVLKWGDNLKFHHQR